VTIRFKYEERDIHSDLVSSFSFSLVYFSLPTSHSGTVGAKKKEQRRKKREREREWRVLSAVGGRQKSASRRQLGPRGLFGIKNKKKETYFIVDKRARVPSLATISSRDETCFLYSPRDVCFYVKSNDDDDSRFLFFSSHLEKREED
jgi:hypothetical protein